MALQLQPSTENSKMTEGDYENGENDLDDLQSGLAQIEANTKKEEGPVQISPKERFWRFATELGSGSYKVVYRGYDSDSGMEIAWNTIKINTLPQMERKRISDEVNMIKKLKHKNFINFIAGWLDRDNAEVIFITEMIAGGSLKKYLKKIGRPKLKVLKGWWTEILKGLHYLHSYKPHPIIHRDIKSENIFINNTNGEIKIGDLGLSTSMKATHNKTLLGTPEFMAPELYDENYGPKVDIYAFGMCALEMVTLQTPYKECKNAGQIYHKVIRGMKPTSFDLIEDPDVKQFIEMCLDDESKRPTAEELLNLPFLRDLTDERNDKVVPMRETNMPTIKESEENGTLREGTTETTATESQATSTLTEEPKITVTESEETRKDPQPQDGTTTVAPVAEVNSYEKSKVPVVTGEILGHLPDGRTLIIDDNGDVIRTRAIDSALDDSTYSTATTVSHKSKSHKSKHDDHGETSSRKGRHRVPKSISELPKTVREEKNKLQLELFELLKKWGVHVLPMKMSFSSGPHKAQQVLFTFDLWRDTPKQIVTEMIKEMALNEKDKNKLIKTIQTLMIKAKVIVKNIGTFVPAAVDSASMSPPNDGLKSFEKILSHVQGQLSKIFEENLVLNEDELAFVKSQEHELREIRDRHLKEVDAQRREMLPAESRHVLETKRSAKRHHHSSTYGTHGQTHRGATSTTVSVKELHHSRSIDLDEHRVQKSHHGGDHGHHHHHHTQHSSQSQQHHSYISQKSHPIAKKDADLYDIGLTRRSSSHLAMRSEQHHHHHVHQDETGHLKVGRNEEDVHSQGNHSHGGHSHGTSHGTSTGTGTATAGHHHHQHHHQPHQHHHHKSTTAALGHHEEEEPELPPVRRRHSKTLHNNSTQGVGNDLADLVSGTVSGAEDGGIKSTDRRTNSFGQLPGVHHKGQYVDLLIFTPGMPISFQSSLPKNCYELHINDCMLLQSSLFKVFGYAAADVSIDGVITKEIENLLARFQAENSMEQSLVVNSDCFHSIVWRGCEINNQEQDNEKDRLEEMLHSGALIPLKSGQLRRGSKEMLKEDITLLQIALQKVLTEAKDSKISGHFGRTTESFVKQFQEEHHLSVTGIVNTELWTSLISIAIQIKEEERLERERKIQEQNEEEQRRKEEKEALKQKQLQEAVNSREMLENSIITGLSGRSTKDS